MKIIFQSVLVVILGISIYKIEDDFLLLLVTATFFMLCVALEMLFDNSKENIDDGRG